MAKTEDDLWVLTKEDPEWLQNWWANIEILIEEWMKGPFPLESLAHFVRTTRQSLYNWRSHTYGPDMTAFVAIRTWLGMDFTEPHSREDIRVALKEALESGRAEGLYLETLIANVA